MAVKLNSAGVSHARSLISSGKINTGEWSFSGEDGDKLLGGDDDWAAYSKWLLGEDTAATEDTKARWKYPFGKSGEVYTGALKAVEGRATQQGLPSISDAAKSLLAAATPDDKEDAKDSGDRDISDADIPEEMEKQGRAHPGPTADPQADVHPKRAARDAADGDPLPHEDDPDGDGDDDSGDDDSGDDDDAGMVLSRSGMAYARALVKAGKVSHDAFTFDGEDRAAMLGPNGTHTSELQRHHLGTDKGQDDATKAPAYPFAKNGRAYSRAFRKIARKAAAAGHDDVAAAANELMLAAQPPADEGGDTPKPKAKKGRARPGHKYRDLPFTVTQASDDGSYFEGYASVYNNIDEYNTIMAPTCFQADLERFRAEGFIAGLNHDWDRPLGRPSVVRSDHNGLFVGGTVLDTAHGLDVRKLLKNGVIKKMSFGFDVVKQRYLDDLDACLEYWRSVGYTPTDQDRERAARGVVLFEQLTIFEASPVMLPGNANANITTVRSGDDAGSDYLTLESHFLAVRAAVEEICDRLERLAATRAKDGRSLSEEKRRRLREIRDRLDAAEAACRPKASPAEVARLRREVILLGLD